MGSGGTQYSGREYSMHLCTVSIHQQGEDSPEHRAKIYHSLVLRRTLQSEVCCITEREKGGVIQPKDTCPKIGQHILDVLCLNHPESCPPTAQSLKAY